MIFPPLESRRLGNLVSDFPLVRFITPRRENSVVSAALGRERRRYPRVVEIHSREEAHKVVEQIAARKVENNPTVKAWLVAKRSILLTLLAGGALMLFLISVLEEVFNLV